MCLNSFVTSGSLIHYASQRDNYTHKESHLVKSERLHPLEAIESYTYAIVPPTPNFYHTFGFGRSVRPRPWSPRQILGFRA